MHARAWLLFALVLFMLDARIAAAGTELVVIGTFHARHFSAPRYHPDILRRLLELARPDVVVVESREEDLAAPDGGKAPLDMKQIVIPWARRRGLPIRPFDYWKAEWREQTDALEARLKQTPEGRAKLARVPDELEVHRDKMATADEMTVAYVHSQEFAERDRRVRQLQAEVLGEGPGNLFWGERTAQMLARLKKIVAEASGKRIVVVTGAAHRGDVEREMAREKDVRVIPVASLAGYDAELPYRGQEGGADEMLEILLDLLESRRAVQNPDRVPVAFVAAVRDRYADVIRKEPARAATLAFFDGELAYVRAQYREAAAAFSTAERQAAPGEQLLGAPLAAVARLRRANMLDLVGSRAEAQVLYRELEGSRELGKRATALLAAPFARPRDAASRSH